MMAMTTNPLDVMQALGERGRRDFERLTESVALPAGHILFHQGEASDGMYLLLAGSLGVYVTGPAEERQLIAIIQPRETVGEMGVLAGIPRTATVMAIRDSELLKLSKARFDRLLKQQPELMAALNRVLVHRLRQVSRGSGAHIEPKTAAILPAAGELPVDPLARKLARLIEADGYSVRIIGAEGAAEESDWFTAIEAAHDHVFLCGEAGSDHWIRRCARQADRIMVVARAGEPAVTALPRDLLQQRADHQLLDLVLIHDTPGARPRDTASWLELLPVNRHFHIRADDSRDWQRLARVVCGRAIGLVLSGGGARAYAHIGALRAIAEAGIEVDFVGGASMGAIIAASLAFGMDCDEIGERVRSAFIAGSPLSDLTLPLISLVKGRKVDRLLRSHFGDIEIPDLWLPFYCASSDLGAGSLCVHRRGRVRDALQASIALPGILPPKIIGDGVLVDGAVLNNLPVDVMRCLHRGPIIAVDVTRDRALKPEMLALTRRRSWFHRLRHPPIVSILMRAGTVSTEAEIAKQAQMADLLIVPQLGEIDIGDWRAFDEAVEIGYRQTSEALSKSMDSLRRIRRRPLA